MLSNFNFAHHHSTNKSITALILMDITKCEITFDDNKKLNSHSKNEHRNTTKLYPSTILTMNQKDIAKSRTFKYLGTKISYYQPNAGDDEVNHRKLQEIVQSFTSSSCDKSEAE